jgi:pimeloyl-ACP methyl ester carboxylesterase
LFPAARIETVAGAGHWVHADAPEAVAALVADFMRA